VSIILKTLFYFLGFLTNTRNTLVNVSLTTGDKSLVSFLPTLWYYCFGKFEKQRSTQLNSLMSLTITPTTHNGGSFNSSHTSHSH